MCSKEEVILLLLNKRKFILKFYKISNRKA